MSIKDIKVTGSPISREDIVSPHRSKDYYERLEEAGIVDLRGNSKIVKLTNGRIKVVPIDPNKKFKK